MRPHLFSNEIKEFRNSTVNIKTIETINVERYMEYYRVLNLWSNGIVNGYVSRRYTKCIPCFVCMCL